MLQLIGFLGCIYLFVKGLEIAGRESQNTASKAASVIAILSSIGFLFAFVAQGSTNAAADLGRAYSESDDLAEPAVDNALGMSSVTQAEIECVRKAGTGDASHCFK